MDSERIKITSLQNPRAFFTHNDASAKLSQRQKTMTDLENTRMKINLIDSQLASLFEERMKLVVEVADYKKKNNMPIFDSEREKQVIENSTKLLKDKDLAPYFKDFIQSMMDISKEYQKKIING